jgi:hypothetical protein
MSTPQGDSSGEALHLVGQGSGLGVKELQGAALLPASKQVDAHGWCGTIRAGDDDVYIIGGELAGACHSPHTADLQRRERIRPTAARVHKESKQISIRHRYIAHAHKANVVIADEGGHTHAMADVELAAVSA